MKSQQNYNLKKGVIRIFLTGNFLRKTEISQRFGFFISFIRITVRIYFYPRKC